MKVRHNYHQHWRATAKEKYNCVEYDELAINSLWEEDDGTLTKVYWYCGTHKMTRP
jgi:uncharacterized protein VirK/YbjX